MTELLVLLVLGFLATVFIGSILGFVAMSRAAQCGEKITALEGQLRAVREKLASLAAAPREVAPPAPTPAKAPAAEEPQAAPTDAAPSGLVTAAVGPAKAVVSKPPPGEAAREVAPTPAQAAEAPAAPPSTPAEVSAAAEATEEGAAQEPAEAAVPGAEEAPAWQESFARLFGRIDQDWWAKVEEAVGKKWMTYLGGLAIFASVGFFVKYAIDNAWIGPTARVVAGLVLGSAIVVAGERFVRRDMRSLGLGLIGAAGLPILYVSLYAAFSFFALIGQPVAFGAMIAVTVVGMFIAIRHDSLVVSLLALLGGLLTPVLVSTGQDPRDALFGYLLVLDLGVLGVAFFKRWRVLDVLAFVGTSAFCVGWFAAFYTEAAMVPALLWLGAFYLAFVTLPFANQLRDETPATLERFIMALVVAGSAFGGAYQILHPVYRHTLGYVALGMAACYVTIGAAARKRVPADVRGVFSFIAFAMTFLTIAAPLRLGLNGITLAWSAQAVLLLYLGFRFAYMPVRVGGLAVLGLAVGRLFFRHWPLHAEPFALIVNAQFGVAAFVCLAAGAFAAVHHWWREEAWEAERLIKIGCALAAGVLGLVVVHAELGTWFAQRAARHAAAPRYLSRAAGVAVWALGSLLFLGVGLRVRSASSRLTGYATLLVAALLGASLYQSGLLPQFSHFRNARFWVALLAVMGMFTHGIILRRFREVCSEEERGFGELLCLVAGLALLGVLTIDLHGWLRLESRYAARCGVAALWTLGAVAYLAAGMRGRSLAWRLTGLCVLLAAAAQGAFLYQSGLLTDWRHFRNARFGANLLVVAAAFAHGLVRRHSREVCSERERSLGEILCLLSGLALLGVLSLEVHGWLRPWGRYHARCGVAALWALGSAAYLLAGMRGRSEAWRATGVLVLAIAVLQGAFLYQSGLLTDWPHFRNARFGVNLLVVAAAFAHGLVRRHSREVCSEPERSIGELLCLLAGLALLVALSIELYAWLEQWHRYYARCGVAALWALGSMAFLVAGIRGRSLAWRATGALVLGLAVVQGACLYQTGLLGEFTLFVNLRFATCSLAVVMTFALARVLRRHAEVCGEDEQHLATFLWWTATLFLLAVLSADAYLYSINTVADAQRARWSSQMALSIVWSSYAVILLAVGFWQRKRPVRLTALGLLGLTALKLVLFDLAILRQRQIYRILSFLVAGLLMIGASYLYHRIEKHLEKQSKEGQ